MALGVHSATHRNLTRLSDDQLAGELVDSRDRLETECGVRAETFSYPYGLYDRRVRDAVRDAGYSAAVTVDYGLNTRGADPWALRRIDIPSSISMPAFEAWLAGLRLSLRGATPTAGTPS